MSLNLIEEYQTVSKNWYALAAVILNSSLATSQALDLMDVGMGDSGIIRADGSIGKYRTWTDEATEDVLRLKDEGYTWPQIGTMYGTSGSNVAHRAARYKRDKNKKKAGG